MARDYAALPHKYLEEMDILSDAEFGRLCRALLQYSMDGKEGQLQGAEKVVWKRVKMQEDRFQDSCKELSDSRRAAGKKGAANRWQAMASDGKAMASDGFAIEDPLPPCPPCPSPFPSPPHPPISSPSPNPPIIPPSPDDDTRARRRVATPTDPKIAVVFAAYGEKIESKSPMTEKIRDELLSFLEAVGPEVCVRAMDEAVEAGAISWRYVRKVLENKRGQGVRCIGDWDAVEKKRVAGKPGKYTAQDFQPTAERVQKNNDWLDAFLAEQSGKEDGT